MAFKSKKTGVNFVEFNHKEIVRQLDTFVRHTYTVNYDNIMRKVMSWINTPVQSRRTLIWKLTETLELKDFNPDSDAIPHTLQEVFGEENCEIFDRIRVDMTGAEGQPFYSTSALFMHPDVVFTVDNTMVIHNETADTYDFITSNPGRPLRVPADRVAVIPYEEISPIALFKFRGHQTPSVYSNFQVGTNLVIFYSGPLFNGLHGRYYINQTDNIIYDPLLRLDDDGNYLAEISGQTKYFVRDYLKDQIRTRYGFFARPSSGLVNVVLDSYFPRYLYNSSFNLEAIPETESIPKTACAISPLIAECLNVKKIPTEQLCRVLGYDTPKIRALLTATKSKDFHLVLAGVGGTGMNTLYWLSELVAMANVPNLFNSIDIFESEVIEYSNMLRFPISLSAYTCVLRSEGQPKKVLLAEPLARKLVRTDVRIHNEYLSHTSKTIEAKHYIFTGYVDVADKTKKFKANDRTVIYGAPNISSRDELSKMGNFIGATHANTSCSLWLNPKQDQDIQVESYGMIQLGGFFMNQLRLAIGLLEVLASEQNLAEQDKSLLRYEFTGEAAMKTDLNYNWQLVRNLNMMTEEEANNQH